MTGREKKLARNPTRSKPHSSRTTPESSASCAASTMYRPGPTLGMAESAAAVIREVIAIGPTDCVMLDPNSAYKSGGTMLAYRPTTGGRPATSA